MRSMIGLSSGRTMLVPLRRKPSCTLRYSPAGLTEQFELPTGEPFSHLLDQLPGHSLEQDGPEAIEPRRLGPLAAEG
jgi:hypothetical protein